MVPVGGDAAAGAPDHPERHQPAALRDAQGDHGRQEERDSKGCAAGRPRRVPADCRPGPSGPFQADADDHRIARRGREGSGSPAARRSESAVILVIAEQRGGTLNRATWEAVVAAQQLAAGDAIRIAIPGGSAGRAAQELAAAGVGEVVTVSDPALEAYTPDGYVLALAQVIAAASPDVIALAHTYQARDFAPMLAARLNLPLVTDVTGISGTGREATFTRPMFQGKLAAEVKPVGNGACVVTVQIGAFRADALKKGGSPSPVTSMAVTIDRAAIRQKPDAPFQEAKQAVDLGQAAR